ncbi:PREDICTED: uncharacterized protein LOC104596864 [Nelumbo nucifera]|uniref:Uncharacterized protein LOC104596864 n=2 Tax=Nelumbo nucifera TaxID=4432 RepID=A0A1U7ZSK3_NELNU|nr:PREDICTED: uncharacterized protein LOC104596864 [Nelumbo nucifera]
MASREYAWCLPLYKAIVRGDWSSAKVFLDNHEGAVSAKITVAGDTLLHIAAQTGQVQVVKELVKLMPTEALAEKNNLGVPVLSVVAVGGMVEMAEIMVRKNKDLVGIRNHYQLTPVVMAAFHGNKEMVHYLYPLTRDEDLCPEISNNGATLLTALVFFDFYDVALDLVRRYPKLAITTDIYGERPLNALAGRPSAFESGIQFGTLSRCIYPYIRLEPSSGACFIKVDIENLSMAYRVLGKSPGLIGNAFKRLVPFMRHLYDGKLIHLQAVELLKHFCDQVSTLDYPPIVENGVMAAIFRATQFGIVEFIIEIISICPHLIWSTDEHDRNIFEVAILYRQEKIFNLIYELGGQRNELASYVDEEGNSLLHVAGLLAPPHRLNEVSGPALQMQRELQWFKEVEAIVQPRCTELKNFQGKTPRVLFSEQHKELVKEGEKWMKDTATSCMVVATLIATVMFAAAFTVPGGNNSNTGIPIFLETNSFMVFSISDALALFSSSTSVLMFLAILTSRYAEDDFLKFLPQKLIIGLFFLFVSIVAMMVAFGATIFIILCHRIVWLTIPITLLASVPVTLFALLQFPLFIDMIVSTYGSGIFNKQTRNLYRCIT